MKRMTVVVMMLGLVGGAAMLAWQLNRRQHNEIVEPTFDYVAAGFTFAQASAQPGRNQQGQPAQPIDPSIAPTTRENNCTIAGCHAAEQDNPFVHGPVAVGACDMCHAYDDPTQHTFKYVREGAAMCNFCHIGRMSGRVVHKPVADGKCLDCHNPHGSSDRKLVRTDTVGDLCIQCHDDVIKGVSHLHTPVQERLCADCHESHFSNHPKLLVEEGEVLCMNCHQGVFHDIDTMGFVHEPVKEGCQTCHNPHGSNNLAQLVEPPAKLCSSCHVEIAETAKNATDPHTIVLDDERACLNCHTPHAAEPGSRLMEKKPIDICLNCHSKPIKIDDTREVASMEKITEPDMFLHGPLRNGYCQGCHEPHGGSHAHLLPEEYSAAFYQKFELSEYALCFQCHDQELVLEKETRATTNFRNGDQNLHYLHVNKTEEPGRNCRACHETHASHQKLHIRESVPYGGWDLPINFQPTETGGSCAAGCHRSMHYDRVNPVDNAPADLPSNVTPGNGNSTPQGNTN